MSAIHTGDIAASAADTVLVVKDGIDDRVAVHFAGPDEIGQLFTHQVGKTGDLAACHVIPQSQSQVVNDAVAILHHGSAHLQVTATQLNELQRIAPCLNATDTTQFHILHHRILGHLEDKLQCDGLHGPA